MKLFSNQPWLKNPATDSVLILLPPVIPLGILLLFQSYFDQHVIVSTGWWVLLVMCIDVSHVYSTTFRFYWEPDLFKKYRSHLIIIPILAFLIGWSLHSIDSLLFWRVLAYMAVFHFIRQQYGFVRLYSRQEKYSKASRWIDAISIYTATLYPLIYWHIHRTQELSWFIAGDFLDLSFVKSSAFDYVYIAMIATYLIKETIQSYQQSFLNIPKNAIMAGTYLSWYFGIIAAQGDLAFTLLNVVSHGIPYMALVWIYGHRKKAPSINYLPWKEASFFLATLILFSYLEEGIWDVFIWKDHTSLFPFFTQLPRPDLWVVSILVPLLSLPQITHYVIDGFIWRVRPKAA
jgi:uncharacterized membrane protein